MKSIYFSFCLLLLLSFIHINAIAQDPAADLVNKMMPNPVPASPNAASLGKYGDYRPSFFTGIPEISLELFTIKSGDLSVPITLSYHASGIRPTDVASWVGSNWSLSTGGQITRSVKGKPDESDYYTRTLLPNPSVCFTFEYLKSIAIGAADAEADVFSYSCPKGAGKFILKNGMSPFLIPQAPFVINPTWSTDLNGMFTKFEVTDDNGVLYRYGQNAQGTNSTESTNATNGGNPALPAVTAWNLMEIQSPNTNNNISYSYQSVGTSDTYDISYSYVVQDLCATEPIDNQQINPCLSLIATQITTSSMTSSVNQAGVQSIVFKTGKVDFVLGGFRSDKTQLKTLDHIDIYSLVNGVYIPQKTIQLVYSYYTLPGGGIGPLKLDAVQFKDNTRPNPVLINQYTFKYTTNSLSWNGNLKARDLWGYYNGANQNTDLILPVTLTDYQPSANDVNTTTLSFGGAVDRTVNSTYIQEGVLNEIDFPTSGYTKFYYEPNKYLDYTTSQSGTPTLAGGLRVTKIESYDGSGSNPIVKTYKYGSGESGYGLPNFSMYKFNYNETQSFRHVSCSNQYDNPAFNYRIRAYHSNSVLSQDPYDQSPVMYPYVTEYIGDAAGANLGKTVYEFDSGVPPTETPEFVPLSSKSYTNSQFWKRGKLTHKTVYDNTGNKLNETVTTYTTYKSGDTSMGLGVYSFVTPIMWGDICAAFLHCFDEIGDYVYQEQFKFFEFSQSSGARLPSSITEYNYLKGDVTKYVMQQTTNIYDADKLQLTQATITNSNNTEQEVTVNKYPFQLAASGVSTGNALGIYLLNSKNIVNQPHETYTYYQNEDGSNQRVVSGVLHTYRQNESNTTQVVPDQIYLWESPTPTAPLLSNFSPSSVSTNGLNLLKDTNYKPRISLLNYDVNGNLLSASKVNDIPVAYQYGYNGALPVAEIKNAASSQTHPTTTTGVLPISMSNPSGTTLTQTFSFTVDYAGPVTLKLGVSGTPSYTTTASWSGFATASNVTLTSNGCSFSQFTSLNIPKGNYSLTITIQSTHTGISACGEIDYPKNNGTSGFYLENFEEYATTQANYDFTKSHSGSGYSKTSGFTVNFAPPDSRTYKIEYWYFDGAGTNQWIYVKTNYTQGMTISDGTALDDIRVYPTDAQMKSYTYDPVMGITSIIDEAGITQRYEYDSFGRLKLIRDDKGKILKQYQYHYKQ